MLCLIPIQHQGVHDQWEEIMCLIFLLLRLAFTICILCGCASLSVAALYVFILSNRQLGNWILGAVSPLLFEIYFTCLLLFLCISVRGRTPKFQPLPILRYSSRYPFKNVYFGEAAPMSHPWLRTSNDWVFDTGATAALPLCCLHYSEECFFPPLLLI